MNFAKIYKTNLKSLILGLTIISALVSLSNTLVASYQTQSEHLVTTTLELNKAYSKKLASTLDNFVAATQQTLAYSAEHIRPSLDNNELLTKEVDRLLNQTMTFNSIVIVNSKGIVLEVAPAALPIKGKKLTSVGAHEALFKKEPTISNVYTSITGKLIVFITHPLFNKSNEYFGFIGGTVYLEEENILNKIIGEHFYEDGSQVSIIDKNNRIISHQNKDLVGKISSTSQTQTAISNKLDSNNKTKKSTSNVFLSGYASSNKTGWTILTQSKKDATKNIATQLLRQVLLGSLPMALISMLAIWWCSINIAKPLKQLADGARELEKSNSQGIIEKVPAWYYETKELKNALLSSSAKIQQNFTALIDQALTDSLTSLHNRRGFDKTVESLVATKNEFSIITIDIDYFKKINDVYGHDKGDIALRFLAQQIKQAIREEDLAFRIGGEEFMIILPRANKHIAYTVAERLRISIMQTEIPEIGNITVSLGISSWPEDGVVISDVLKSADKRLYQAKQSGRNKTIYQT